MREQYSPMFAPFIYDLCFMFYVLCFMANAPWRQQPENSLKEYLVDDINNNKLKAFLRRSLCEPGENLPLDEKKRFAQDL